jgi:putative DNA primase/helicase
MNLVDWSRFLEERLQRPSLIRVNGKAPLDQGWPEGPFNDPDGWRDKLNGHQGNVGVVLGRGLAVVDVDSYKPRAEESWDALVAAVGLDLNTVIAATGGGGRHFYFRYPAELHVGSIPLGPRGYPGIEVKADGGMVVVEPSVHPVTGQPYLFEHDSGPADVNPTAFTTPFLELVGAIESGPRRRSRGRWHPLADDDQIDPADRAFVEILCTHFGGHSPTMAANGEIAVSRPGKDRRGSKGFNVSHSGPGVGWCFTDSWPPFEQNRPYDLGQLRRLAGLEEEPHITVRDIVEFPPGYRSWREGDGDIPAPTLSPQVRHGPIGDYLDLIEGATEAHPAAVGALLLAHLGVWIGHRFTVHLQRHVHAPVIWVAVLGPSSIGAKGSADDDAGRLLGSVSPGFYRQHTLTGVGSGENLVRAVRDVDRDDKGPPPEKDRLIADAELSALFKAASKDGSNLSEYLRKSYDSKLLRHSSNTAGETVASAGSYMVAVAGSITPADLARVITATDISNGWLNRFCLVWSEATASLPRGGRIFHTETEAIAVRIVKAVDGVRQSGVEVNGVRILQPDESFWSLWDPAYDHLRFPEGTGPETDLVLRFIPFAARISLVYALLDGKTVVGGEHLGAAFGWLDYFRSSVHRVFGYSATGKAGQLLEAIRAAGPDGLDGAGQDQVFRGNAAVPELRTELEARQLICTFKQSTGGRPRIVSVAIWPRTVRYGKTEQG